MCFDCQQYHGEGLSSFRLSFSFLLLLFLRFVGFLYLRAILNISSLFDRAERRFPPPFLPLPPPLWRLRESSTKSLPDAPSFPTHRLPSRPSPRPTPRSPTPPPLCIRNNNNNSCNSSSSNHKLRGPLFLTRQRGATCHRLRLCLDQSSAEVSLNCLKL